MEQANKIDAEASAEKPSAFLLFSIFILMLVNMQDGFDILAISFAAQAITEDWGISRTNLGIVFSAGLLGMMLGAMFLAPLADRLGRKLTTIIGLSCSGCGMLICMAAPDLWVLVAGRVFTGLGVGAILASLNTLVAEYAGARFRVACVSMFQLGFPIGAFLSGFVVAYLLDIGTWRHIFAFGAFTSFIFIPLIMLLPESTDYLARQNRPDALAKINVINKRFGRSAIAELPVIKEEEKLSFAQSMKTLFAPQYAVKTMLIWSAFFLVLCVLYFLLSWTPKIVIDMGFTEDQGNQAGRLINFYGMAGILLLIALSLKIRPAIVVSAYMGILAILLMIFENFMGQFGMILVVVSLFGACINGSMIGLYSTTPSLYPPHIRATGTGWAIGISRFGAVLGPGTAGYLFDAGWSVADIFKLFALPAVLAVFIAYALWVKSKPDPKEVAA